MVAGIIFLALLATASTEPRRRGSSSFDRDDGSGFDSGSGVAAPPVAAPTQAPTPYPTGAPLPTSPPYVGDDWNLSEKRTCYVYGQCQVRRREAQSLLPDKHSHQCYYFRNIQLILNTARIPSTATHSAQKILNAIGGPMREN